MVRIEAAGGLPHWQFKYDGLGRRVQYKQTDSGGSTTRRHKWCGAMICQSM